MTRSTADLADALRAEWTKVRTVAGTGRLLVAAATLMIALSSVADAAVACPSRGCGQDPVKLSLTGIQVGQAVIAIVAVLVISDEFSTGLIRTTLTAMPRRGVVLTAKAAILSAVVLAAGMVAVLGSLLAGRLILPGNGFSRAHGFVPLSPADGPMLRAGVGSILYLVLIALLSLGIATAVRDSATAVGLVLGLLYLFPILIRVAGDPRWQRHLQQLGPMNAGLAVQTTVDPASLPIGPWAGLGVLTAWAAVALLAGGLLLRRRDA